jgi:hypothetical protein
MNRKAQIENPVLVFAIIVVGLIIFAPIMLKIFTSIQSPMSTSLGSIENGGDVAQANFDGVMTPLVTMWDQVMIAAFVFSLIILLVSAFLIDTHPFWVVLYLFTCMFTILFAPTMLEAADKIYDSETFATEASNLSFMDYLRQNFAVVIVGVMVLSGIIIYGKIAWFGGGGR